MHVRIGKPMCCPVVPCVARSPCMVYIVLQMNFLGRASYSDADALGLLPIVMPAVLFAAAISVGLLLPATAPTGRSASIVFVTPASPLSRSPFGATSPAPGPAWTEVASHLTARLPGFDERISASVVAENEISSLASADLVICLGVSSAAAPALRKSIGSTALLTYGCEADVTALQQVGSYSVGAEGADAATQAVQATTMPWADVARGKRLVEQCTDLFSRNSSEDMLYAIFFVLHAFVIEMPIVKYTVNPTWEKGGLQNAKEFLSMCDKCGDKIGSAILDPETKATIDLLNACDMRDQVGSYRVIVSYETPLLEEFSLCILQQNNCFECDAAILDTPRVPLLGQWRGEPVDDASARQIFIGHFDCAESHPEASQKLAWSWKVVCGANPAYDAFPAQHQIFYPSEKSKNSLWYDPVFKVNTLDGRDVWCKRHYKCVPRTVAPDLAVPGGSSAGAWTLSTLDNGVISKEHWTTVDAADDLSWAVFHYSGAAAVVGQSYLGGLLCSADGQWPERARSGPELERIQAAFRKCAIEQWELYGHGVPSEGTSFMWTEEHAAWEANNPPPLEPIGDESVQAWRAREKAKVLSA